MSNADGTLLAAVSTHENQTQYAIEFLRFNKATDKFEAMVVEISGDDIRIIRDPVKQYEKEKPERKCTRCHGKNLRPIWDNYPIWPGFVGSMDKTISPNERSVIERFLQLRDEEHPVYSALRVPGLRGMVADEAAKNANRVENDLQKLNARRIFRELKEHREYERFALPLFFALAAPKAFHRFFADSADLRTLREQIDVRQQELDDKKLARMLGREYVRREYEPGGSVGVSGLNASAVDPGKSARIEYVLKRFGLTSAEWSLALEKRSIAWRAGYVSMDAYLLRLLIADLSRAYPGITSGLELVHDNFTSHLAERHPFYSDEKFIDSLAETYRLRTGTDLNWRR